MGSHQTETETRARSIRDYITIVSALMALFGVVYFVGLVLVVGLSMSFISYYQAVGYIDSAQVAWLSAPTPLPHFYWYTVPAPIALVTTPIAFLITVVLLRDE